MPRIRLMSMLLLPVPVVCVVVRSAKQFRLQCTFESLQWRQLRDRRNYVKFHRRKSTWTTIATIVRVTPPDWSSLDSMSHNDIMTVSDAF